MIVKFATKFSYRRYFGLKPLILPVENNFVPLLDLHEADVILNPIALILCYYTSMIFLQDIYKRKVCSYHIRHNQNVHEKLYTIFFLKIPESKEIKFNEYATQINGR